MKAAIANLPGHLEQAARVDWSGLGGRLAHAASLYTLGRGPSYAMSGEAALKFKETCQIHAENYSSAEVLHGPVSIVSQNFPVLAFAAADAAEDAVIEVADAIAGKGATVFVTSDRAEKARQLPVVRTDHPLTDPLAAHRLVLRHGGRGCSRARHRPGPAAPSEQSDRDGLMAELFTGADIFDGERTAPGSLLVEDGRIAAILPPDSAVKGAPSDRA